MAPLVGGKELRTELIKTADGELALTLLRCGYLDGPRNLVLVVQSPQSPDNARRYRPQQAEPTELVWTERPGGFEAMLQSAERHAMIVMDAKCW